MSLEVGDLVKLKFDIKFTPFWVAKNTRGKITKKLERGYYYVFFHGVKFPIIIRQNQISLINEE